MRLHGSRVFRCSKITRNELRFILVKPEAVFGELWGVKQQWRYSAMRVLPISIEPFNWKHNSRAHDHYITLGLSNYYEYTFKPYFCWYSLVDYYDLFWTRSAKKALPQNHNKVFKMRVIYFQSKINVCKCFFKTNIKL